MLNVVGSFQADVPSANVATLDGALIAAGQAADPNATATITDQTPSGAAGNFLVTASFKGMMDDATLAKFVGAVVAAVTAAGGALVPGSGSMTF